MIVLFIAASTAVEAQNSELLDRYRKMALEYNHDLRSAERNIEASIELEKAARTDRKPKLSAGGSFNYVGNPSELTINMGGSSSPFSFRASNTQYGASVTFLQPIYTGGLVLEKIKMAQNKVSYSENLLDMVHSLVCYQTDIQYWNSVARKEMTAVARNFHQSMKEMTDKIRERVDAGLIDRQDLLMAEVKLNDAEYRMLQCESSFETGVMALNSIIGVTLSEITALDNEIPAMTQYPDSPTARIRPEIKMAENIVEIEENKMKMNDSKYKPQVYVGADGNYSSPGYNFKSDLVPNYVVYANVSVPIFEWGKRKNEKIANRNEVKIAEDKLNKVYDETTLDRENAKIMLKQSTERVRLTYSSIEKAEENRNRAMEKYNEGEISIVEVIDAQIYKLTSEMNHIEAKLTAQCSYCELIRALGLYCK